MSKQFVVKVFTPKGLILEKSASFLRLPGKSGDVGVFSGHTTSLIECNEGEMLLKTNSHVHAFFLPTAIAHITKNDVTLLVNYLEPIESIDKKRAEASRERALARINAQDIQGTEMRDIPRAKESLLRAEHRLEIIAKHHLN